MLHVTNIDLKEKTTNNHPHNMSILKASLTFIFPVIASCALRLPTSFSQTHTQIPLCALKAHKHRLPFNKLGQFLLVSLDRSYRQVQCNRVFRESSQRHAYDDHCYSRYTHLKQVYTFLTTSVKKETTLQFTRKMMVDKQALLIWVT